MPFKFLWSIAVRSSIGWTPLTDTTEKRQTNEQTNGRTDEETQHVVYYFFGLPCTSRTVLEPENRRVIKFSNSTRIFLPGARARNWLPLVWTSVLWLAQSEYVTKCEATRRLTTDERRQQLARCDFSRRKRKWKRPFARSPARKKIENNRQRCYILWRSTKSQAKLLLKACYTWGHSDVSVSHY